MFPTLFVIWVGCIVAGATMGLTYINKQYPDYVRRCVAKGYSRKEYEQSFVAGEYFYFVVGSSLGAFFGTLLVIWLSYQ